MIQAVQNNNINQNKITKQTNGQSFKGGATAIMTGLRFLNDSPAIGACAVDLCSMVTPRTVIETKNRGKESGIETFLREGSSSFLHANIGLIGLGAATALSGKFNEKYNVKAQNIFAGEDVINNISSMWESSEGNQKKFFEKFTENISGLNGEKWKKISEDSKEKIIEGFESLASKTAEIEKSSGQNKKLLKQEAAEIKNKLVGEIIKNTGAKSSFKLSAVKEGCKDVESSLSELVDNAITLTKSFGTKKEQELQKYVKDLIKNKKSTTKLGIGICAAICLSIQPINRYLTKKRTGKDGFVGVEGEDKSENSPKFKAIKTAAGIIMPLLAIRSIGKPSEILSKIQFNGKFPRIDQFKFLYGLTIGSRFMSARDSNELRESMIKDTLGFTNWLILGGMVSKLTARGLGGKELINNPIAKESGKKGIKYALKWLTKSSVKSFDEILIPSAKKLTENGKVLKFSKLLNQADKNTKTKLAKIAIAQIAGYIYSGLVLGVGISKLNIGITKKVHANKKMSERTKSENNLTVDNEHIKRLREKSKPVFKDFN